MNRGRSEDNIPAHEPQPISQLLRVQAARQRSHSSPHPLCRPSRDWGHHRDRCRGGQGAPRCEFECRHRFNSGSVVLRVDDPGPHYISAIDGRVVRGHERHIANCGTAELTSPHHNGSVATHNDDRSSNHHVWWYVELTSAVLPDQPCITERSFRAIGTMATVLVQDKEMAETAETILRAEIDAIDRTCSRFRPDSELEHVHANAGRPVRITALLFEALEVAYSVAERTDGAVDPTVGNAISALGYNRDFGQLENRVRPAEPVSPVAGFRHLQLNSGQRTVNIPRGIRLDLGASAKALITDRASRHIADELGSGILVSIGGDVAVAGPPPPGGWAIGIAVDSSTRGDHVDQVVAIREGGLASSSTAVRTWQMGEQQFHHIVDPSTGKSSSTYWRLVSAAGASCVDANALSTAALVWGAEAPNRLSHFDQALRLLRHDGEVVTVGGWPKADET